MASPGAQWPTWFGENYTEAVERLIVRVDVAYKEKCARMLRGEAYTFAQGWQDWYIWHNVFRHTHSLEWGDGFYLDIGSNHPTQASNTLFFDKCLGWQGVCFEPQVRYHGMTQRHRSCKLVPACVLGSSQSAVFSGYGPAGRLIDIVSSTSTSSARESTDTQRKRCVVAAEALRELGYHRRHVDLMSVDIEGSESSVLRCWPFKSLPIRAILMETEQYAGEMLAVDRYFHRHGYANVQSFSTAMTGRSASFTDNLFVRQQPLPVYPNLTTDDRAARGSMCPHGLRAHMHWWCAPFMMWEPESKLWGRCDSGSAGSMKGKRKAGPRRLAVANITADITLARI